MEFFVVLFSLLASLACLLAWRTLRSWRHTLDALKHVEAARADLADGIIEAMQMLVPSAENDPDLRRIFDHLEILMEKSHKRYDEATKALKNA